MEGPAEPQKAVPQEGHVVTFTGTCDASGAVPLEGNRFALADDEDNLIRIYESEKGGAPLAVVALAGIENSGGEMDLEAATRIGDDAIWLASHSRSKSGKEKPKRLNMFVSTAPTVHTPLELVASPQGTLLDDFIAEPALAEFTLAHAASLAPKTPGALNIEGMTARPDGGVFIGFRNPVPDGKALIVGVANPLEAAKGLARAKVDAVHRLDLGEGRGVRGLSVWRGRYLLLGGTPADTAVTKLFTWDGVSEEATAVDVDLADFNPEAFYTPEHQDLILVISDDGLTMRDGLPCKKLKDPASKQFRGIWVRVPSS
tara:strand:- start:68028 stop:68972 length:945 start_codon:yes stop_codon:yes gene_type:complete